MSGNALPAMEQIRLPPQVGKRQKVLLLLLLALLVLPAGSCRQRESALTLGGGPRGGTFENISAKLAEVLNEDIPGVNVVVEPSGGSLSNLLDVERGRLSMGLVFSGDAFLGREGRLKENLEPMTKVVALARLYGATAHLVVSRQSSIRDLRDLRGRRIAIGSSGSGSALAARRYFESLGLWESIIPIHEGYAIGIEHLQQGGIDAVWMQVGYPSEYLQEFSRHTPLRFLDLSGMADSDFFTAYPFYTRTTIPGGTYHDQNKEILSFQDSALWVASTEVSEELVYQALKAVFSEQGLKRMRSNSAARDLSVATGLTGVKIPLHPGAERFWRDQKEIGPAPLRN